MSDQTEVNDLIDRIKGDRDRAYVASLLLPDDAKFLSPEQKEERAELLAMLYDLGLSLSAVGRVAGGLSRQRVLQILREHGHLTRPAPGSKRWREQRAAGVA